MYERYCLSDRRILTTTTYPRLRSVESSNYNNFLVGMYDY